MLQPRRSIIRLARCIPRSQPRRYESSESHAHAHHSQPVNESLGRRFYATLALIPFSFALYKFTNPSSHDNSAPPLFTRLMERYSDWHESWTNRNASHVAMLEQAAHDRNLFHNSRGSHMVDLKFPEIFNTGCPWNVPAGHSVDLSAVIAHYEKRNRETEEKVQRRMRAMQEDMEKFDDAAQGKEKPAAPVPVEVKKETKAKGGGAWWS